MRTQAWKQPGADVEVNVDADAGVDVGRQTQTWMQGCRSECERGGGREVNADVGEGVGAEGGRVDERGSGS